MFQKLIIIGRLGQDPEMRYTQSGTPVANFSVATDKKWKTADGEQKQQTVWFRVSAWNRLAETCNQYLSKGKLVMIEGELRPPRVYKRRDDEWAASLEVTARNVKFLSPKSEGTQERATEPEGEYGESEIPF